MTVLSRELVRKPIPRGPAGVRGPINDPTLAGPLVQWQNADGSLKAAVNYLGPEGPAGNAQNFDTRAILAASSVSAGVNVVRTAGYAVFGDGGGATYLRADTEPTHEGKVESLDGAWWEIYGNVISPEMFGAIEADTAANDVAFPAMDDFLGERGGGVVFIEKLFQIETTRWNITHPNITVTTNFRHVGGIWRRPSGADANNGIIFVDGRGVLGDPDERLANDVKIIGIQICADVGVERTDPDAYFGISSFNADNLIIEDCYIHDVVNGTYSWNGRGCRLIGNKFRTMTAGGSNIENGCEEWVVAFNDYDDTRDDVIAVLGSEDRVGQLPEFTPYVKPTNIVVIGNTITRTHDFGNPIRCDSSIKVIIEGNIIDGCGFGGISLGTLDVGSDGDTRWVRVVNNKISNYGRFYSADDFYDISPTPDETHMGAINPSAARECQIVHNTIINDNATDHPPFGAIKLDGRCRSVEVNDNYIIGGQGGITIRDTNFTSYLTGISVERNNIVGLFDDAFSIAVIKALASFTGLLVKDNVIRAANCDYGTYITNIAGGDKGYTHGNILFGTAGVAAHSVTSSAGMTVGTNINIT